MEGRRGRACPHLLVAHHSWYDTCWQSFVVVKWLRPTPWLVAIIEPFPLTSVGGVEVTLSPRDVVI